MRERPLVRVTAGRRGMAGSQSPGVRASRPLRFASVRWLGDKRTMVVHDLDAAVPGCRIDEVVESGKAATFGPDTPVEAANRGYRACRRCRVI